MHSAPVVATDGTPGDSATQTRHLLESPSRPTAILYDDPALAAAGLRVARELAIRVPDELSVVSDHDALLNELTFPQVTAVFRDSRARGRAAARALTALLDGAVGVSVPHRTSTLRLRASTTAPSRSAPSPPTDAGAASGGAGTVPAPRTATRHRTPAHTVTMDDIARRAGVSRGAVSYALNGRPGVSDGLRERIQQIALELGFTGNTPARVLRGASTEAVGLVMPRTGRTEDHTSHGRGFVAGVQQGLAEHGWNLVLRFAADRTEETAILRRWHAQRRVDGVLVLDTGAHDPRLAELARNGLPAVTVGRPADHPASQAHLPADDSAAVRETVRHLAALGHRRIGWLLGPGVPGHETSAGADLGAEAARSTTARLTLITGDGADTGPDGASCARRVRRMLTSSGDRPTALVCSNDLGALIGVAVARELGLSVPADLSIMAWQDAPHLQLTTPQVTAVDHDVFGLGTQAVHLLLARIGGTTTPRAPTRSATLRVRQSTGRAPG
jgi:DNA-binding LacI/PurR family transcriptional regulator